MIKRKMFYSVVQENNIVGLRKQDGYEIEVDGIKFNAYKNMINGRVYILDPKNGIAVFIYSDDTDVLPHHDLVEKAKDEFVKRGVFEIWKEKCDTESYQLTNEMFNAYKKAESLRERQKELAQREIEENRRQQDNENNIGKVGK